MHQSEINVFNFVNYKTFFKTVYEDLKFHDSHFSYRTIQKLAGFSHNSNHFWQILEGRRPISESAAMKYGKVFGLNTRELKYLKLMVKFDLAKNDSEKNKVLEAMKKFRNFASNHLESLQTYDMFSDWYLPILWDMVDLDEFKEDYKWISQQSYYNISPALAEKGIKKLLKLGLLTKTDGKIEKVVSEITTETASNPIVATAHRNYLRQSIGMSVNALEQRPIDQRLFAASTLLLSKSEVVAVRAKLLKIIQNINKESNESGKERLYQLNLQYFSLLNLDEDES
ncbi:TIGR02147 family protein [bacterium]|nr:TIGR02147 family protein [bacterium]